MRPVITGMGAMCSLGMDLDTCMASLFTAPPDPAPPAGFRTDHPVPYPVFSLPGDPEAGPTGGPTGGLIGDLADGQTDGLAGDPAQDPATDLTLTARMAVAAARQALADAGLTPSLLRGKRVGVCMGTTVGASLNNDPFYKEFREGNSPGLNPIKRFLRSSPAAAVARAFDLAGPVQTIVNACASGSDAIGIGAGWIRAGLCDLVIAGGTDELCRVTYNGFISLMITDPAPCRPFDAERNGLNLGEGAAAMVLEPGTTQRSGSHIRARVAGYGAASDAYHLTAPRPDGRGLSRALARALADAGTGIKDIGFINAHGTGTRDNDKVEMAVFREHLPGIPFLSTKGYTGHTLGAAGALEAVFTVACMNLGKIPPSRGFSNPDPESGLSPVTSPLAIKAPAAISQSVAFGGNNAVLVFTRD